MIVNQTNQTNQHLTGRHVPEFFVEDRQHLVFVQVSVAIFIRLVEELVNLLVVVAEVGDVKADLERDYISNPVSTFESR